MKQRVRMRSPTGSTADTKIGFSWPAFFFGPFWALFKRAWLEFALLGMLFGLLVIVDESFVQPSDSVVGLWIMFAAYLGYMVVCGLKGNEWLRASLKRKGYVAIESKPNKPMQATCDDARA